MKRGLVGKGYRWLLFATIMAAGAIAATLLWAVIAAAPLGLVLIIASPFLLYIIASVVYVAIKQPTGGGG